ncbi:c-type cytochrome [Mesorhizobium sp. M6A.T.Ce.TU.002.03.1.1]|uniref:c-type cytochrome n=1 Tax=unclassified Mesorhizobium TaxID=325217 RepID=UPI000FCA20C3|nr:MULTISPECIES: c-type cytochrome [unclassified Mesorhizobium]RUU29040.1 c-type cytochrome [Mesorhizobium sp. M6A.T.Ce.TU.016.01.1.1]RUU43940.1 c-type cytochrome [Mesorhizobium sp. M6A.T.Ce.TU.002.03.1.1]RUU96986.1 c-type cytochrome [Mesorhizobium sp. M6A.T.Cr.TU.017.01.1.1]RWP73085.1 MAG: c-type cytochrome [Mesorhizobium sp.]
MNHSHATTRTHISAGAATASLQTSVTRARRSLAALLVAGGLLLPSAASAQQADGERLFRQRCGTCHSLEPGQNRVGPHLSGVIGRTSGSVEGARYSAAMRESGIVWDSQSLDSFLAAPRQRVPGTSMTVGVPNAAQRAAIIGYLEGAVAQ